LFAQSGPECPDISVFIVTAAVFATVALPGQPARSMVKACCIPPPLGNKMEAKVRKKNIKTRARAGRFFTLFLYRLGGF
jgi:hypothetical protein